MLRRHKAPATTMHGDLKILKRNSNSFSRLGLGFNASTRGEILPKQGSENQAWQRRTVQSAAQRLGIDTLLLPVSTQKVTGSLDACRWLSEDVCHVHVCAGGSESN